MSDKEESVPVASPAATAAPAQDNAAATTTESSSAPPVEDPKIEKLEISAPAAEENSEETDKPTESEPAAKEEEQATKPADDSSETPRKTEPAKAEDPDIEMTDAPEASAAAESNSKDDNAGENKTAAPAAAAAISKTKAPNRRKSTAAADKGKSLNKKASKAQILHTDAKPGDHYFIKLKGFPQWPCIICDEDMLPNALLKSRPVSALNSEGKYREDFADGGKNVANRTFPIMYLATNEFGWVSNKDLIDLDPETVLQQPHSKKHKDLVLAHQLAEENHNLDYYKGVLNQFQEELLEKQKMAEAKASATAATKSNKKKGKSAAEDEDVEMDDVDNQVGPKKDKKRKAGDPDTPQRAESVKKPKIKLTNNSTPKLNGSSSKVGKLGGDSKSAKKSKQPKQESEERVETPVAPELTPLEKFDRKKKEVLFLRHKLQKGLLTRDQQPKEDEMKMMSEYLQKLEGFPDLETDIIRITKINKVLKAMLKLDNIPKEEEFSFKPRSQALLDTWNRLLAQDVQPAYSNEEFPYKSADEPQTKPKSEAKSEAEAETKLENKSEAKSEVKPETNGVKTANTEEAKASKHEVKDVEKSKDALKKEDESSDEKVAAKKEEVPSNEEKPKVDKDMQDSKALDTST